MSRRIYVKNNNLEEAMKKFKRISTETKKCAKRHQYYLRDGIMKREKSKAAQKKRYKMVY